MNFKSSHSRCKIQLFTSCLQL